MPRKPAVKAAWGGRIGGWDLDKRVPVRGRKLRLRFNALITPYLDKRVPVRGRKLDLDCIRKTLSCSYLDKRVPVRGRKQFWKFQIKMSEFI